MASHPTRPLAEAGFGVFALSSSDGVRARLFASDVPRDDALRLLPGALCTGSQQRVITLPGVGGPIDVWCERPDATPGGRLEATLAAQTFTRDAVAWDLAALKALDPLGGAADRATGLLRCVGDAAQRLREEPLRALRAARLLAEAQVDRLDPALREALADAGGPPLAEAPTGRRFVRARTDLVASVLGPRASAGLDLLRTGALHRLVWTEARPAALAWLDAVPADLVSRLGAWLDPPRARAWLRRWRIGVARSNELRERLAHHPLDVKVNPRRDGAVGRLLRRLDAAALEALFAQRRLELSCERGDRDAVAAARTRLSALESAVAGVRAQRERRAARNRLAIGGGAVMELLGCAPGRRVGRALRHLGEEVAAGRLANREPDLRAALEAWARHAPDAD